MSLNEQQKYLILRTIWQIAGEDTDVYLFGSRPDDRAKGGDIDLFLESNLLPSSLRRAQIKMQLEHALGLPVDLVCKSRDAEAKPFEVIAKSKSVKLEARQ
ncbi:nucleotidyltransferase domain-containing protein [Methylomonas sp. MED-D]|uniref:nucleotidyltransferase domain-containing protein n=1 Tax=unclassified Methylomonas TaxID=2608980 RepID=UPI003917D089